jgi:hypothetical protein
MNFGSKYSKINDEQSERDFEFSSGFPIIHFIYLLNLLSLCFLAGSKHQSHQDYLEKADKARSQRLSSSPASAKS